MLNKALENGAVAIGAAALPQFAATIYTGYFAYKGIKKAVELKREYDKMKGTREEKIGRLAAREGIKALAGEVVGKQLDKPAGRVIETAVNASSAYLSRNGVFSEVVKRAGFSEDYSKDLRYFYTTTAVRSLQGAYSGAKDTVSEYVAGGIIR